ncbi:hypothetical protein PJE062_1555 [Pseudovibrio sp. JE062]|nr:hypothetical protein PJE062_1555 [Pseudovibrio sp. JE062]
MEDLKRLESLSSQCWRPLVWPDIRYPSTLSVKGEPPRTRWMIRYLTQ